MSITMKKKTGTNRHTELRWRRIPDSGLWVVVDGFGRVWQIQNTRPGNWRLTTRDKGEGEKTFTTIGPDHPSLREAKAAVEQIYAD